MSHLHIQNTFEPYYAGRNTDAGKGTAGKWAARKADGERDKAGEVISDLAEKADKAPRELGEAERD